MPNAAPTRAGAPLRPENDDERALLRFSREETRLMDKLNAVRQKRDDAIYTLLRNGVRPARVAKLCGKTRGLMTRYVRALEKDENTTPSA